MKKFREKGLIAAEISLDTSHESGKNRGPRSKERGTGCGGRIAVQESDGPGKQGKEKKKKKRNLLKRTIRKEKNGCL